MPDRASTSHSCPSPHQDAGTWDRLIESLGPAAILVLISTWMGRRLEQQLTAEDIWQEALYMAWRDRAAHRWQGPRTYRSWILSIARNRVRSAAEHMSAQKRGGEHQTAPFSTLSSSDDGTISAVLPPHSTTPSHMAHLGERAGKMAAALGSLPPDLQQVVRMRMFEELPTRTVAKRMGLAEATVKKRLYKGAQILRGKLQSLLRLRPGGEEASER